MHYSGGNMEPGSPNKKKASLTADDFNVCYRLGKGAYGDVFLVTKKTDGRSFAMKQIQKRKLAREEKEYQAMVEKELLTCMQHPGNSPPPLHFSWQGQSLLHSGVLLGGWIH